MLLRKASLAVALCSAVMLSTERASGASPALLSCGGKVEETTCMNATDPEVDAACDVICANWDYWVCDAGNLTCYKYN